MGNDFAFLQDYQPEKVADNFAPFKGNYDCIVNYARIEEYSGDKEDFKGHKFFRYELAVGEGQPNAGRRLWKSVDLQDEKGDKSGKTKAMKLADMFFTLGFDITNDADIEKFANSAVKVNCYYFKGDNDEQIQMHQIKAIAQGEVEAAKSDVPF